MTPSGLEDVLGILDDPGRLDAAPDTDLCAIRGAVTKLEGRCVELRGVIDARLWARLANVKRKGRPCDDGPNDGRYLTAREAAAIVGMAPKWLYRHAGQIPGARRFGSRSIRFQERAFRQWAERQRA